MKYLACLSIIASFVGCSGQPQLTPEEQLTTAQEEFREAKEEWSRVEMKVEDARMEGMERCFERWSRATDIELTRSFREVIANPKAIRFSAENRAALALFFEATQEDGSEWKKILIEEQERELRSIGAFEAEERFVEAEANLAAAENKLSPP